MKRIIPIILIILSGCSSQIDFVANNPSNKKLSQYFSFLPFNKNNTKLEPSEKGVQLIDDLNRYESLIDEHLKLESYLNKKRSKPIVKNLLLTLLNQKIQKESIDDKINDIDSIRALTKRYESWSDNWIEQADIVKNELTYDDLSLIKSEIKRIYKKL